MSDPKAARDYVVEIDFVHYTTVSIPITAEQAERMEGIGRGDIVTAVEDALGESLYTKNFVGGEPEVETWITFRRAGESSE